MRFRDRRDAGRRLAERLVPLGLRDAVVLGLPRGGVPVAAEVAAALDATLDVFVVRKIGAPHQPEYGIGAVAEGGSRVVDDAAVRALHLSDDVLEARASAEAIELARRVARYRGERALPDVRERAVVVVDDGLATGVTAEAALTALRSCGPSDLVLAAPVGATDTVTRLTGLADQVVCVLQPDGFRAVGEWYDDFTQTTDEEVVRLLAAARA